MLRPLWQGIRCVRKQHYILRVSIGGTLLNFAGGLLLVWDAIRAERRYHRIRDMTRNFSKPLTEGLPFVLDAEIVKDNEGVQQVVVRRSATRAMGGFVLVAFGFLFQLVAQMLDKTSIFSSKDEPEDGGWGFLSRWGSFRAF